MHYLILGLGWFSKVKGAWLCKDLKVWDIQATAELAQLDKYQNGMAEVPGSILTGGNILLMISFCFPILKAIWD